MLENLKPVTIERSCKVRTVLDQLEVEDGKLLTQYLADSDTWSSNGLAKALNTRGVFISANTITKHRQGGCSC